MRLLFLCVFIFLVSCTQPQQVESISGNTMGTYYSIKFWQPERVVSAVELKLIKDRVESVLKTVNAQMSTYIDDSELSLLNNSPVDSWKVVSPELLYLLQVGKDINQKCDNAFDMTVGPLVNLWGFGPDLRPEKLPTEAELKSAFERVGSDYLRIENDKVLKQKDLYIDLSSFAKGYGVDKVADTIMGFGFEHYIVDIGGEIRVAGHKPNKFGWKIAVASPDAMLSNKVYRALDLTDIAMATSGDYRNYFESDGIRYSHTIDPKTGYPIKHRLASVSVLDKSSMMSDALATCLMVKGEFEGFEWAEDNNIPAYFIYRSDDGFDAKATTAFEQAVTYKR